MGTLLRRLLTPAIDRLDRFTRGPRAREGSRRFFISGGRHSDALLSRVYFSLAAWHWGGLTTAEGHTESFRAGLAHCREPARVLDLGTGAGASAALLADAYSGARIDAVDLSGRMIAEARARHPRPNLAFRRADVDRLPFPDREFDLVTLHNATPDMAELRRVVRPGGQVMTASTYSPLAERGASVRGRWTDFGFAIEAEEDVAEGAYEVFVLREDAGPPPLF